ncbi:MAG: NAD(+) synthase, partial [Erysipelotrichaceae bacterium]|nr:NAD(+) synthase [Erysipelotrichaceae bacterium]
MRNRMFKVGNVVPKLKVADVTYNVNEIIKTIEENSDCGLLVYPELCITSYTCGDLFNNDALLDKALEGLKRIADCTKDKWGLTVVVSLPIRIKNNLFNCAAYVSEGKLVGLVPKINIPTYSEFYESRWFVSGKEFRGQIIQFDGYWVPFGKELLFEDANSEVIIGTDICEDLWIPDKPSTHACLAGANIIVNPSASDETIGKQDYRRSLVSQQSADCYCAYLYVSSGVDESSTDMVFSGHCMICENGSMLADDIFPERSYVQTAIIDLEKITHNRIHQNTFDNENNRNYQYLAVHVKPVCETYEITVDELVEEFTKENYFVARNPFVPADDDEREKRCKRILQIQANGLATRVRSTGIKTLVIGISGGLDSTLALIVCHEAKKIVPDIRIIGYTLPNRGNTTSLTYNNAINLMKALNIEIREVAIEEGVKAHLKDIGHSTEYQGEGDVTYENAQARMRTYILMDAANMENGLVVGTGD